MKSESVKFSVNLRGETTGEQWIGEFEAKPRLSHRDEMLRDRVRRQHLGMDPQWASERALNQAMIFANLDVRLTKWPRWWVELGMGLDASDDSLIAEIFENALRIEKEALEEVQKRGEEATAELKKKVEQSDKDLAK